MFFVYAVGVDPWTGLPKVVRLPAAVKAAELQSWRDRGYEITRTPPKGVPLSARDEVGVIGLERPTGYNHTPG